MLIKINTSLSEKELLLLLTAKLFPSAYIQSITIEKEKKTINLLPKLPSLKVYKHNQNGE